MPGAWTEDKSVGKPEGKYLVVRRDGTVPPWPHFVLSLHDPATKHALNAYADDAQRRSWDKAYAESVRALARKSADLSLVYSVHCDPDSGPHRQDNAAVVACMRHEADLTMLELADLGLCDPDPELARKVRQITMDEVTGYAARFHQSSLPDLLRLLTADPRALQALRDLAAKAIGAAPWRS